MASYKEPSFNERQAAAAKARQEVLDKLKSRAPVDPAIAAAKKEAAEKREAVQAEKRAAKKLAAEEAKALAKAAAQEKAEAIAAKNAKAPAMTEEERKAERDRRYAARKARKK